MIELKQPENSRLCGQYCISMVTGIDIKKAVGLMGHPYASNPRDIMRVLKRLKVPCSGVFLCTGGQIPEKGLYICKIKARSVPKWGGHWVVVKDGELFDPSPKGDIPFAYPEDARFTSYLRIDEVKDEMPQPQL